MPTLNRVSAAMLAGLLVSTVAVWVWGDSGIYGVRMAPVSAPGTVHAAVGTASIEKVSLVAGKKAPAPEVVGVANAIDSATVSIGGKAMPIAGLKPVQHRQALAAFNDYLSAAGQVACHRNGDEAWTCVAVAEGTDIGEVAILSGLAFTGVQASQRYLDAEKDARQRKAGIWGAR